MSERIGFESTDNAPKYEVGDLVHVWKGKPRWHWIGRVTRVLKNESFKFWYYAVVGEITNLDRLHHSFNLSPYYENIEDDSIE
jgi:hypothetical protein